MCLARAGLGLVFQSSLRTGPHPTTWAPPLLPLDLLALLLLLVVLGSGDISVSTRIRESTSIFSASGGTSSGAGTTVTFYLLRKVSPDLGGRCCCCCFTCRGSSPCAPFGAFFLACGEAPPRRAVLFSSRDGDPSAIVGAAAAALIHSPRVLPLRSFDVRIRPHCRARLLSPLTGTCLAFSVLDAGSNRRAQSPHPLAGAVRTALLRYWPQPRPLPR